MVYILSNGRDYSEHVVYFVETEDDFNMREYLKAVGVRYGAHQEHWRPLYIIGISESNICWLGGGSGMRAMGLKAFQEIAEYELACMEKNYQHIDLSLFSKRLDPQSEVY